MTSLAPPRGTGAGLTVPYVALWSGEESAGHVVTRSIRAGGYTVPVGIGYPDETPGERDSTGVLWDRVGHRPGAGRPLFTKVHPLRQRRAMRRLLCQVCAQPADQNDDGTLWLLTDYRDDWPGWPENMANHEPPLCLPCARLATRLCPGLRRRGHVAIRAHSIIAAVSGTLFQPGHPLATPNSKATLPLRDSRLPWLLASALIRTLHDCTFVDLG